MLSLLKCDTNAGGFLKRHDIFAGIAAVMFLSGITPLAGAAEKNTTDDIFKLSRERPATPQPPPTQPATTAREVTPRDSNSSTAKSESTKTAEPPKHDGSAEQVTVDLEDGLRIQTRNKDYAYKIGGRIQVDSHSYDRPKDGYFAGADSENHVFDIQRARLEMQATMARYYQAKLTAEFAGEAELKDAYLNVKYLSDANVRVGQFTYPYSTESLGSSKYAEFAESSAIKSAVASGRDRGVAVMGQPNDGVWHYVVGIFNGAPENTRDNNQNLDQVIRIVRNPEEISDDQWNFWLGAGYTTGKQLARDGEALVLKTESKSGLNFLKAEIAADVEYTRTRNSFDITTTNGPMMVKTEYYRADYDFENKVSLQGIYVLGSYFLTGEQRAVKNGQFEQQAVIDVYDPEGDGRGAWEIAARYSVFQADPKFFVDDGLYAGWAALSTTKYANAGYTWTLGVNWYPDTMARVMLDYIQTFVATESASSLDAAVNTKAKNAENTLLMRFQLEF